MLKKPAKKKTDFHYQPSSKLTPLRSIETSWDLAHLYYKNERDSRIEADVVTTEKVYTTFVKKWSKTDFTRSAKALAQALTEKEKLAGMPEITRPGRYFAFRSELDANDKTAEKQLALLSRRLRKVSDSMLFFELTLGQLPKKKQQEFLNAKLAGLGIPLFAISGGGCSSDMPVSYVRIRRCRMDLFFCQ